MRSLLISIVVYSACCLVPLANSTIWDDYLDDGSPSSEVEFEEERQPLFLAEPTKQDCDRANLRDMLTEPDNSQIIRTASQDFRRKTIEFCRRQSEKDMTDLLARLNDGLRERVNKLVESMIKANRGVDFQGPKLAMPDRSISEGILIAMEQGGLDLSMIKTRAEFNTKYNALVEDCNEVDKLLNNIAHSYLLFLNHKNDPLQLDQATSQWTKNTLVCEKLTINPLFGLEAFRLLRGVKEENEDHHPEVAPIKGGGGKKSSGSHFKLSIRNGFRVG